MFVISRLDFGNLLAGRAGGISWHPQTGLEQFPVPSSSHGAVVGSGALIRSVHHEISGEHGAASYLVHTGRKPSETIIFLVVFPCGSPASSTPGASAGR